MGRSSPSSAHLWASGTLLLNILLLVGLALVFAGTGSQLALAQSADSLMDLLAGLILLITAWVGSRPRDQNHPFGHQRAEPIGALLTAVLAGVLALEVGRSAVTHLAGDEVARMDSALLIALTGKVAIKSVLAIALTLKAKRQRSPALRALLVDSRNDVLVGLSSLVGFALARMGYQWADAGLALPVAAYIGWSGFELARENLNYLMGAAPAKEVVEEITGLARKVQGVATVEGICAHYVGHELHVEVTVVVRATISATQSHDIGVDVQHSVEEHPLVAQAFVHLDTPDGKVHGESSETEGALEETAADRGS